MSTVSFLKAVIHTALIGCQVSGGRGVVNRKNKSNCQCRFESSEFLASQSINKQDIYPFASQS